MSFRFWPVHGCCGLQNRPWWTTSKSAFAAAAVAPSRSAAAAKPGEAATAEALGYLIGGRDPEEAG